MKIISLGWGVQSFTLAAMSALGELESVDAAIHADTTHERSETYDFARRWTPWLEERGVRVVTVKASDAEPVDRFGGVMLPAYTWSERGEATLTRQCTDNWKRAPLRRWISEELKRRDEKKAPGTIEQWLGISLDEFARMKMSDVRYITHRWPLIERRMTRHGCKLWLERHALEIPPRSACIFCPFQSSAEWRYLKTNPENWAQAVRVDGLIRNARPPEPLFIHPARIPLEAVDLRNDQDRGQLSLWDNECSGYCGV